MGYLGYVRMAVVLLAMTMTLDALAQASPSEIIDQARARARHIEEIKQVLSDPDQNVRLAAFEAMVTSDDPLMRELALDAGLASTDRVLRGLALRHAVLGLAQLTITLAVDDSAPKPVQERTRDHLEKSGNSYVAPIDPKGSDLTNGAFHSGNAKYRGNVSGLVVTFSYPYYTGELHLQDDNSLAGVVYYNHGSTNYQFKASAPLR